MSEDPSVVLRISEIISDLIPWILGICWVALVALAICVARWRYKKVYWTHWYDLSRVGPLEEMDWQQVRKVTNEDPWEHKSRRRWPCRCLCIDLFVSATCVLVFLVGVLLICDFGLLRTVAKGGSGFGVPAALAALGGTAVAVFYNVRLTARANNRQVWINSVRRHMHVLIANCPSSQEVDHKQAIENERELTMLELMLNPGERVHRSLMAILRLMHRPHDPPLDAEALCELDLMNSPGRLAQDKRENNNEYLGDLKVKATRLEIVLLKREWEQVKHVR